MFITRLSVEWQAEITGDITQIDLPTGRRSGLLEATDVLAQVKDIAFITFDEKDVVRHDLVQRIVRAYEEYQRAELDSSGAASGPTPARPELAPSAKTLDPALPREDD